MKDFFTGRKFVFSLNCSLFVRLLLMSLIHLIPGFSTTCTDTEILCGSSLAWREARQYLGIFSTRSF